MLTFVEHLLPTIALLCSLPLATLLGVLEPHQQGSYRLRKRGTLNIRPAADGDGDEYLLLPLDRRIQRVRIFRQSFGQETILYGMSSD